MNTTNANIAAVATDFTIEKSQAGSQTGTLPPASQDKDKPVQSRESSVSFTKREILEMTEALNEYTEELNTNLGFSVREGANKQIVVEIKNTDTNETIKQFPPEELLEIKEKMAELVGLIFEVEV